MQGRLALAPARWNQVFLAVLSRRCALVSLHSTVSFCLGFRSGSALTGIMSLKIFGSMTVGYSYDFGVNDLSVVGRSSHEIVISLTACDKNDPYVGPNGRCPAYD